MVLLAHEEPFARKIVYAYTGWRPVMANAKAYYKIIYDLSVGAMITLIFFFLVVWIPDYQRRQRLKKSLEIHYKDFRKDCIQIMLLVADGSYSVDVPETLMEQDKFRDYFHEKVATDRERWHELWNNFNAAHLRELAMYMGIFRDQISFVLNNTDIPKNEPFEFLKRLSIAISSMKGVTLDYDELKPYARFLWSLFTGWDFSTGYPKEDVVKKMIDAI